MNKNIKIALFALVAMIALGGGGVWYAISSIDQIKLTQLLSSAVKEATGRDLKISGPVSLTFFPSVGVVAEDISLSNASWVSNPEMLNIKSLDLDVKLLPLFSKRVEISQINLSGIDAHLQTNSAGAGNWILAAPLVQGDPSKPDASSESSGDQDIFVAIEAVNVKNAQIAYRDASGSEKKYQIAHFSLRGDGSNTIIKLDAKQGDIRLGVNGKVTAVRKILNDWDQTPLKIEFNINVELNEKMLALKGNIQKQPKAIPHFDLQLSSKSFDVAPLAGASAVAASGAKGLPAHSSSKSRSPYFFSNEPLPWDLLPEADGRIDVNINQLGMPDRAPLKNVTALIEFNNDQIELRHLNFQLGTGSAEAQASIGKFHSASPSVSAKGEAKGYTLEQVLKAADGTSKVSGGDMRIAFDLKGSGASLHQLVGDATGNVQILVGSAKVPSSYINKGGDFVVSLFDAINPLRKRSNQTVLECAAAFLPVNNGLMRIDDSVGVQTDRLDVVLSGTVNLKTEVINLNIHPREKSGLTTGLDLANLITLQGTLEHPSTGINKTGVVTSAVSIGVGILTGGASILAENAKSMATKSQPCKAALHPWSDIYSAKK